MYALSKCTVSQKQPIFFEVPEPPKKPEEVAPVPVPKKVEPPPAKGRIIFLKNMCSVCLLVPFSVGSVC